MSDYLSQNFHHIFNSVYTSGELETIFDCIEVTLYICDKNVEAMNIPNEGSTVVTAFFYRDSSGLHLTVANCGDSRAVLSQNNTAIRLSYVFRFFSFPYPRTTRPATRMNEFV